MIRHLSSQDFMSQVSLGNVDGVSALLVIGKSPDIIAGDGAYTVWDAASTTNKLYTYLTADTTLYLSSTSALDTMTVIIFGLDENYNSVVQTKALTGQTQVAIDTDLFRVSEIRVSGAVAPAGDIYLSSGTGVVGGVPATESDIKAKVIQGNGRSNMGMVTVPAGKSFSTLMFRYILPKGASVSINAHVRPIGGFFISESEFPGYQNNLVADISSRFTIPEKADVEFRVSAIDVNTPVFLSVDFHAYDNALVSASASFLKQWEAL